MKKIVLIGASTGGPGHLKKLIASIPPTTTTSFVVVQHMHAEIIKSFVSQLSQETSLSVSCATDKVQLLPAHIYICADTMEFSLQKNRVYLNKSIKSDLYFPSVEILFSSALCLLPSMDVTALLLTGIGHDGANAMYELYKHGAKSIAESQESAIVYGMPKRAYEINKDTQVMHLNEMIKLFQNV